MPKRCSYLGCKNYFQKRELQNRPDGQLYSLHRCPKDPETYEAWRIAAGQGEDWRDIDKRICTDHFRPEDIVVNEGSIRLRNKKVVPVTIDPLIVEQHKIAIQRIMEQRALKNPKRVYKSIPTARIRQQVSTTNKSSELAESLPNSPNITNITFESIFTDDETNNVIIIPLSNAPEKISEEVQAAVSLMQDTEEDMSHIQQPMTVPSFTQSDNIVDLEKQEACDDFFNEEIIEQFENDSDTVGTSYDNIPPIQSSTNSEPSGDQIYFKEVSNLKITLLQKEKQMCELKAELKILRNKSIRAEATQFQLLKKIAKLKAGPKIVSAEKVAEKLTNSLPACMKQLFHRIARLEDGYDLKQLAYPPELQKFSHELFTCSPQAYALIRQVFNNALPQTGRNKCKNTRKSNVEKIGHDYACVPKSNEQMECEVVEPDEFDVIRRPVQDFEYVTEEEDSDPEILDALTYSFASDDENSM